MSNHYHPRRVTPDSAPLRVVLFRSRRKDNTDIEGFHERFQSFLTREPLETLEPKFIQFTQDGLPDETSRFYASVNPRGNEQTRRELLHLLIDETDVDMATIGQMAVSVAAKPHNAAQRRWLFDVDTHHLHVVNNLIDAIRTISVDNTIEVSKTPNGYHVICEHGFDTRNLQLPDTISLHKDALTLHMWATKQDTTHDMAAA